MRVGVPKEIKAQEFRVGLVPDSVKAIVAAGSSVIVERGAGYGIGFTDEDYIAVGATIVDTAVEVFQQAELIVKVKEPQAEECRMLKQGQTLFTYLHLAADAEQTQLLQASGVTAIAYETVTNAAGGLPLLVPMSAVAGRLSVQAGVHCLEKEQGGSGILPGGIVGVPPAKVLVIGGGIVGTHAIAVAMGMGASVTVLDKSILRLQELAEQFGPGLKILESSSTALVASVKDSDLVVGAVLVPGAVAPKLVTRAMIQSMRPGSVVVDVAIDQGGCFETSKPTTHRHPTYVVDGVVHYCVSNMPGAVPRTSTFALNNATLPFVLTLVTKGVKKTLQEDPHFLNGLNIHAGMITCLAVAEAFNERYVPAGEAL